MKPQIEHRFVIVVAIALSLAGVAKIWSVVDAHPSLSSTDPVFLLKLRTAFLIAAALEFGVAAVCLFRPIIDGLVAVAWLSTVFLTYRIGLWWVGWQKPCSCLGNLTDALHISPQLADNVMKGLLGFMLIGSVSLLILHQRQGRAASPLREQPTPEPTQA